MRQVFAALPLIMYSYSSFVAPWGAGPKLTKSFHEAHSHCAKQEIKWIDAGSGSQLVNRLKLEGEKTSAQIVIGVDDALKPQAQKDFPWLTGWKVVDRAPLAFIYNDERLKDPPRSLDDLLNPKYKNKIAIEDPRFSTVGLGFLLWVIEDRGEQKAWDYFRKLKPQLRLMAPTWDLAYGLFKKRGVDLVLSFWTSPVYHIDEEKNHHYKAALFKAGHHMMVEWAAMKRTADSGKCVQAFFDDLTSAKEQKIIAQQNYMFPAVPVKLDAAFDEVGTAPEIKALSASEIQKHLKDWLKTWDSL